MAKRTQIDPEPSPGDARTRILDAALTEFSSKGLAGARTEAIAAAAGVNKALLYYYFKSKESLYDAALDVAATRVVDKSLAVLQLGASPGEKLLRMVLQHFDRILSQQEFQSLMQQEMIRRHRGESSALPILVKRFFEPLYRQLQQIVTEGIAAGELISVDWMQMVLSVLGANIFYFMSAPLWQSVSEVDLFNEEVLLARRIVTLQYVGLAVFSDRGHGATLAAKVLADTPMPEVRRKASFMGER
jgi:TetR/AcrR family transcriptional regulator